MSKILVTGGCGYIGSHTIVDLLEHGFEVICVDNNSRSDTSALDGIKAITGKEIHNHKIDLRDIDATTQLFANHPDIKGVIHFAAFKSVPESVQHPLMYFDNNVNSLLNVMKCIEEFNIPYFVFSSSCSVYGNTTELPVKETTALSTPESPYGRTKVIGEQMISDWGNSMSRSAIMLRYFNPAGAHPSAKIGEQPIGPPQNLVPAITQTGIGKLPQMNVFGNDYDTRDGSCIRDYVHVMDIAHAHTLALQYAMKDADKGVEIFNLGSGEGVTVLEAINAYERVSNRKLNYQIASRRAGDVVSVYADNSKAKEILGWNCDFNIDDIMRTAWEWELRQ